MKQIIDISLPDTSQTQVTLFQKPQKESGALLIVFPAMGVKASYYEPFASYLAEQGLTTITADLRGLGQSSIRPSKKTDYGYEEMMQLDYLSIFKAIDQKFPHLDKYVLGHSLGGQLASLFLSRHGFDVKGLILLAACSVHPSGWETSKRWRVNIAVRVFPLLVKTLGYFPGDKIGFGGKAARQQLLDWCDQGQTGKYKPANSDFDYELALSQLKIPTLAIPITNDNMAPAKAMKNLYQKLHLESKVTTVEFTPEMAGFTKLNHFNWARRPAGMGDLILNWIK